MSQVLIVEDQAPMRRLLRQWVEAEGASAIEAETAEEGLQRITEMDEPAVALCDVRLPGHSGVWLAEQLRVLAPHTSIVMTTGVHDFEVAVRSLQTGAVDYVAKPFSRERFQEALHRAFAAHTARRAVAALQQELETGRARMSNALAELEINASSSIDAMLTMLQSRDPGARDTAHRVARTAVHLALALDIREPELSDIEHAALLHHIGKVALPDDLLARPAEALSPDDRAVLALAPVHAHSMLLKVPFLSGAAELVLAAYERYDGSGYPHRRQGTAIPLGARIIGLAAAFDELVGGRAARMPPLEAVAILSRDRAGEFDPTVVAALEKLHAATPGGADHAGRG